MIKEIIFEDSFAVSGIMCHSGCGKMIQSVLSDLSKPIEEGLLPQDAELIIDAEPQSLGIHRLSIKILSEQPFAVPHQNIRYGLVEQLDDIGHKELDTGSTKEFNQSKWTNWQNILINFLSIAAITGISLIFPPSILLTSLLTLISFSSSAFTSRHYLRGFIRNLRLKEWANMNSTITLGWVLSLVHSLYHSFAMPLSTNFSMLFMSFIMPIVLITIINGMDELKRHIMNQSKKLHLQGINSLFPQMATDYECLIPSADRLDNFSDLLEAEEQNLAQLQMLSDQMIANASCQLEHRSSLIKSSLIRIKSGACFPVDCLLLQGHTLVDASLLSGEPQQEKQYLDSIPAGAINLGDDVVVYATNNSYNSTVNKLLFRANRAQSSARDTKPLKFTYFYSALVVLGLITSIVLPLALGVMTIPLLLQNITGILFAVCPCTIGIAHQLPNLLSIYSRSRAGIRLSNESQLMQHKRIHTIVFDKTGTLTTGHSAVESAIGISPALWQRLFLLEKNYGAGHPLAKAICTYYETRHNANTIVINDITQAQRDVTNRGLTAIVQGKRIHIGSSEFLEQSGITLPHDNSEMILGKLAQGFSAIYVAEEGLYCGVIFIKHELRANILSELQQLKERDIRLIMLTGDNHLSASGFNQQNGSLFAAENIFANQTPEDKEAFIQKLMSGSERDASGIYFVGDGLNDAPCAREMSDAGGVSCSMTSEDKSSFFTDLSLNGSLNYLVHHQKLNRFISKIKIQNQALLMYSALVFLAFIISFSVAGIAVSPLIPMAVMVSTTLLTLYNSYRVHYSVRNALNPHPSWINRLFTSDWSLGLPVATSFVFIASILMSTLSAGSLIFPAIVFSAGLLTGLAAGGIIISAVLLGIFVTTLAISWLHDVSKTQPELDPSPNSKFDDTIALSPERGEVQNYSFGFNAYEQELMPNEYHDELYNIGTPEGHRNQLSSG